jgi:transposase-like protein
MTERREGVGKQGRRQGKGADGVGGECGDGRGPLALIAPREGGGGERSEPQPTGRGAISFDSELTKGAQPDPEVVQQAKRRRFTAKYKLSILEKADACIGPGQLGALLRREGLYSSNLKNWRRQREQGSLTGLAPKKRGPRPDPDKELLKRIAKLEKENLRLADKLEKAELIIEVQKKVARLLGAEQSEDRDGGK